MNLDLSIEVADEDLETARLDTIEKAIHAKLDRMGIPRSGRTVAATFEVITVEGDGHVDAHT